jgi:hypothetical protein
MASPTVTCYDITGAANTQITTPNDVITNDGNGKAISCIVEYKSLGASCAAGTYQATNGAACTDCGLDFYCPGKATSKLLGQKNLRVRIPLICTQWLSVGPTYSDPLSVHGVAPNRQAALDSYANRPRALQLLMHSVQQSVTAAA